MFPALAELDKLESALEVRRSNRLELFDFYRRQKLEEICARADEIIDGEYSEAEEAGNQDSASGGAMVQRRSPADGEHLANEEVECDSLVPAQCEPTSQVEGTVAGTSIDAAPTDRVGRGVGGPGNEHRRGQEKADGAVD